MNLIKSMTKPIKKPDNPNFSSGPCAKRPGWKIENLNVAITGRSHRCSEAKSKLKYVIDKSKKLLNLPKDYVVGIMPGSDTGALEAALWSLLGINGVDVSTGTTTVSPGKISDWFSPTNQRDLLLTSTLPLA